MTLPTDDKERKALPIFDGPLMYFPDAIAEVARVCKIGNDQHNPGQPMHWARGKSMDQMNTAVRHMMDHGTGAVRDVDGGMHLAKAAWRILAALQLAIETERTAAMPTLAPPAAQLELPLTAPTPVAVPKVGDRVRVVEIGKGSELAEGDVGVLRAVDKADIEYDLPFEVHRDGGGWDWVRRVEIVSPAGGAA